MRSVQGECDLAVIGGGSGGLAAAQAAAARGAKVVLFEPGELGGTCVNAGCVPKKAMWLAAGLAEAAGLAARIGLQAPTPVLDWGSLRARRQAYIAGIRERYRRRLHEAGIIVVGRRVHLRRPDLVEDADGQGWRAAHVLVATGAQARRPDIPGATLGEVSDDVFAWPSAPRTIAIIGGGYVAVELASLLCRLGTRVHLLVRGRRLLPRADAELAEALAAQLRGQGVQLAFGMPVTALEAEADGVKIRSAGRDVSVQRVLFAIGRRPAIAGLGLEALGLVPGRAGELVVDADQATTVPGVHAVGDVTGAPALTPVAVAAGRRLAARLFGGTSPPPVSPDAVPTVVFAHPPLAQIGLTERVARERHGDHQVQVFRARFTPMLRALAGEHGRTSLFKLVCVGREERVVGLHLLGDGVDEILQGFAVAFGLGLTRAQLHATLPLHPTSAEELVLA